MKMGDLSMPTKELEFKDSMKTFDSLFEEEMVYSVCVSPILH